MPFSAVNGRRTQAISLTLEYTHREAGSLDNQAKAAGSNLELGASWWKVCSYLPMPGDLQCCMHWFPPPVKTTRHNMTLTAEHDIKHQFI